MEDVQNDQDVQIFFYLDEKIIYKEPISQIQAKIEHNLIQNPNDIKQLVILGQIYYKYLQNETQALQIYKKILQLDPKNIDARIDLEFIFLENKCESQEIVNECFELNPNNWRVYYLQSVKYIYENQPIKSKKVIQDAHQMFPDEPHITLMYAQSLSDFKFDKNKINNMIDEVVSKNKLDYDMILRIAYIYGDFENSELEVEYLQRAISINPNSKKAINNLAYFYRIEQKYDNCIEQCEKALKLDQNYEDTHYNLSICYEEKQEYQKSQFYLKKCFESNKNFEGILEHLAENGIYYINDYPFARLALSKALRKNKKSLYGLYLYLHLMNNITTDIPKDVEEIEMSNMQIINELSSSTTQRNIQAYNEKSTQLQNLYQN